MKIKPIHADHCNHGIDCFLGSYLSTESYEAPGKQIDVYEYINSQGETCHCLRYGNEPSEYISPYKLAPFYKEAMKLTAQSL